MNQQFPYNRTHKCPFDSFNEECGVFGVYSDEKRNVAHTVYYGLYALQHRGQESCGIAVAHDDKMSCIRDSGLVPEVFANDRITELPEGDIAIGHVKYSVRDGFEQYCQPLMFTGKFGRMAIAHNGNIVNAKALRDELIAENIVFQTSGDTEVVAALINKYSDGDVEGGIIKAASLLVGSYAIVIMTTSKLYAVRDPKGMRPMVLGKSGGDFIVASETCALDAVGADIIRDIEAGEVLSIDGKGLHTKYLDDRGSALCIFEYVYFARPDSIMDGVSVYEARKEAGKILAQKFPVDADIVSGVPDSAVVAARGYAEESGIPYVEALNKNRYVGRTFIQPEQGAREVGVRIKLNALRANIQGKRIVLIDDSIVRGTTCRKIVDLLKKMGAKEVHMRICSPVVKHPCYFGIDTQTYAQLIGARMSNREMAAHFNADSLEFLNVKDLVRSVADCKQQFCLGCFTGDYPLPVEKHGCEKRGG